MSSIAFTDEPGAAVRVWGGTMRKAPENGMKVERKLGGKTPLISESAYNASRIQMRSRT